MLLQSWLALLLALPELPCSSIWKCLFNFCIPISWGKSIVFHKFGLCTLFYKNPQPSSKHTHLNLNTFRRLHGHPESVKMLTSVSQWKFDSSEVRSQTPVTRTGQRSCHWWLKCSLWGRNERYAVFLMLTGQHVLTFKKNHLCSWKPITSSGSALLLPVNWEYQQWCDLLLTAKCHLFGKGQEVQLIMYGYYILKPCLCCHMQLSFPSRFVYGHMYVYMNEN